MSRVPKIASSAVPNRKQTPFFSWLRNKLLAVNRDSRAPPSGIPGPDGKQQYYSAVRFPNTQAARAKEMPTLPGGVNHRMSDVYYYERDGRRHVMPPSDITLVASESLLKGPESNFGISSAPTPGFGYQWNRSIQNEQPTQANDSHLKKIYGLYRFGLAPNEQNVMKGFVKMAFVNTFKEYVWRSWQFYVPPVVAGYLIYDWAKKANYKISRKNPKDYENDV